MNLVVSDIDDSSSLGVGLKVALLSVDKDHRFLVALALPILVKTSALLPR